MNELNKPPVILLDAEACAAFVEDMENPRPPNEALRALFANVVVRGEVEASRPSSKDLEQIES